LVGVLSVSELNFMY